MRWIKKALIGLQGVVKENTARHSGSSGPIKEEFAGESTRYANADAGYPLRSIQCRESGALSWF
jgi:hypothetical protein